MAGDHWGYSHGLLGKPEGAREVDGLRLVLVRLAPVRWAPVRLARVRLAAEIGTGELDAIEVSAATQLPLFLFGPWGSAVRITLGGVTPITKISLCVFQAALICPCG